MTFRDLPIGIRIRAKLCDVLGYQHPWTHDTHVRFPEAFGPFDVEHKLIDPSHRFIDCSSQTTYVEMSIFPEVAWNEDDYGDMQTFADRLPDRPFCSVEATERRGVGSRVLNPSYLPVGTWGKVQGWRRLGPSPSGHSMLFEVLEGGLLRIWQSSIKVPDGPGYYVTSAAALKSDYSTAIMFVAFGEG